MRQGKLDDGPTSNLTKDDVREKIYLERRLELSFESVRWFDLVRTGRAFDTLKFWV